MARDTSCDMCGLPVLGAPIRDSGRAFCCEGCRRVWVLARDTGLGDVIDTSGDRAERSKRAAERKAVAAAAAGARRRTVRVGGMWCSSCALVLEDALLAQDGVVDAEVSYAAGLARVTWDPERVTFESIEARIRSLGYDPGAAQADVRRSDVDDVFLRMFVGAVVGMWVMWPTLFLLYPPYLQGAWTGFVAQRTQLFTGALSLVVLLYSGWPFIVGTYHAARVRRVTMDTLVVLGTWSAWLYSFVAALTGIGPTYFESASMITTIVLFGRWLEALGTRDALAAAARAVHDEAAGAWRAGDSADGASDPVERIPAGELAVGDTVLVRAGERVPVDGRVLDGASDVDAARLTGEPLPAPVSAGDTVYAGSLNLTGLLRVRATAVGEQSMQGRFAALVEDAAFAKASAQRLADSAAAVFVPVVICIALAAFAISLFVGVPFAEAVSRMVAVLVVACPCALGLAVPMAVVNATAASARHGMALRGGPALERAGSIATVAFDKTGTLTTGRPELIGWLLPGSAQLVPADASATRDVLALAAAIEAGDPHPVAQALETAAVRAGVSVPAARDVMRAAGVGVAGSVDDVRVEVGGDRMLAERGLLIDDAMRTGVDALRAGGSVAIWTAIDGPVVAGAVFADTLRNDAASTVATLRERGIGTVVISGDAQATTAAVAKAVGIDDVRAEVLPHDKELIVRESRADGPVAFIGDGVNDAAALAASDLAVVTADASDLAIAVADVVLPPASMAAAPLSALPALLRIAAAGRRVIFENLGWAFTYNLISIPLAALGLLSPIAAAAAMAFSSLAVIANSWRLRFAGGRAARPDYTEQRSNVMVAAPGAASPNTSTTSG